MLNIYMTAGSCGLVLLLATIFLGDSDVDADTDVDLDPDIDFDAEVDFSVDGAGELDAFNTLEAKQKKSLSARAYLPFLSFRFWTYGMAIFGLTGFALETSGQDTPVHLTLATTMGIGVGWAAALVFRKFKNTTVDSSADTDQLRGTECKVILTVRPGSTGKIRLNIKDQMVELPATTCHTEALPVGSRALIVESASGQVEVVPFPEISKDA
jgi:hypothetical protein